MRDEATIEDMKMTLARLKGQRERSDDRSESRARAVKMRRRLEEELRMAGVDPATIRPTFEDYEP